MGEPSRWFLSPKDGHFHSARDFLLEKTFPGDLPSGPDALSPYLAQEISHSSTL